MGIRAAPHAQLPPQLQRSCVSSQLQLQLPKVTHVPFHSQSLVDSLNIQTGACNTGLRTKGAGFAGEAPNQQRRQAATTEVSARPSGTCLMPPRRYSKHMPGCLRQHALPIGVVSPGGGCWVELCPCFCRQLRRMQRTQRTAPICAACRQQDALHLLQPSMVEPSATLAATRWSLSPAPGCPRSAAGGASAAAHRRCRLRRRRKHRIAAGPGRDVFSPLRSGDNSGSDRGSPWAGCWLHGNCHRPSLRRLHARWCSKRRPALVPPLHQLEEGAGIIVAVESEPCRQLRWQQTADSMRRQAEVQVASRAAGGGGCMRRPLGQRQ